MSQPTTGEARTQLVRTVVAVVVGGLVFAFSGDFVIGVGGAAVFALAGQATKVWGCRTDRQANITPEPDREPVDRR